jgi:hypothetical protein
MNQLQKVVEKKTIVNLKDQGSDLAFWLSKTPQERVAAVTFLSMQQLKEGERMNRTIVNKFKLKP